MYKKQSGSVLVISLVALLALTLFVISGSQTVMVQEKMTAAVRDMHVSLEIAESGVRDAEQLIEALSDTNGFSDAGLNGLYSKGNAPDDVFASTTWSTTNSAGATTKTLSSGEVARYFIEYLGEQYAASNTSSVSIDGYGETLESSDVHLFRIVARSLGRSGNTARVVESHYAKSFN